MDGVRPECCDGEGREERFFLERRARRTSGDGRWMIEAIYGWGTPFFLRRRARSSVHGASREAVGRQIGDYYEAKVMSEVAKQAGRSGPESS